MFAGQGAQRVGMGFDLYQNDIESKKLFDAFPEVRDLCFTDKDNVLNETKYAQKAILLESYVVASYLKRNGINPEYALGLSLGEYSALCFANSFSLSDGIKITAKRGDIMQNALPLGTSAMAAVIGAPLELIENAIKDINGVCEIANYNSPAQIVITGDTTSIDEAMIKLKEAGAKRVIKLNVSGAFHSSLLNNASDELYDELSKYDIKKPSLKIVYNTYALESNDDIKQILKKQIKSSVRFMQSIEYLISKGVDTFIEIGPGATLSGFVKKINPNVAIYNTDSFDNIKTLIGGIKK